MSTGLIEIGIFSQGGAAAARWAHTPEAAGSNPALATLTTLAGRGPNVCRLLPRLSPAPDWPGIFFVFVHVGQSIFFPEIRLSERFRKIRKGS